MAGRLVAVAYRFLKRSSGENLLLKIEQVFVENHLLVDIEPSSGAAFMNINGIKPSSMHILHSGELHGLRDQKSLMGSGAWMD